MGKLRSRLVRVWLWARKPSLPKSLFLFAAIFFALRTIADEWNANTDRWILFGVTVTFALFAFFMLRDTISWTFRGLGILYAFVGIFLMTGWFSFPSTIDIVLPLWVLDLARAAYIAAGAHLFASLSVRNEWEEAEA